MFTLKQNARKKLMKQSPQINLFPVHACVQLAFSPNSHFLVQALVRFPPKERQRRFGEPGTEEHIVKQQNYRKFIVDKLVQLSIRFINSIKANLHCFPPALAWLISHVFTSLTNAGRHDTSQVCLISIKRDTFPYHVTLFIHVL